MANTIKCKDCILYYEIRKPNRDGKGYTSIKKGHCLDRTIYAKGKPGSPVYPPGAKIEDLPYNRHKITLVREDAIIPNCSAAKSKKGLNDV